MITIDLRKVSLLLLVVGGLIFLQVLPDLQRYLRIRSM